MPSADHRAIGQARTCTAAGHRSPGCLGGTMSPGAGGHARNPRLVELHADATGCAGVAPAQGTDAMLPGAAMAAATAAAVHQDPGAAATAAQPGPTRRPNAARRAAYAPGDRAFLEMCAQRRALDRLLGVRA